MPNTLAIVKNIVQQHAKLLNQGFNDEEYRMLYYNLIETLLPIFEDEK